MDSVDTKTAQPARLIADLMGDAARMGEPAALAKLQQRLQGTPSTFWVAVAEALLGRELPVAAIHLMDAARRAFPDDMEVLFTFGAALRLAGDGATAEQVLTHVMSRMPEHDRACLTLALLHRDRGQNSAAAQLLRDLHKRRGGADLTLYVVDLLRKCRRERDAMAICEAELQRAPEHARLQFVAGGLALTLGRFEDARRWLLAALDRSEPEWGALMPLALTRKYLDQSDPDLTRFRQAAASPALSPELRSAAGFALGKALDDLGDFAGAASALTEANRHQHSLANWSASNWDAFIARQIESPPPLFLDEAVDNAIVPIFVVGLPRSGTTLVAELLARHPEAVSRGELPWLSFVVNSLMSSPAPDVTAMRRAAALYLAQLRQDDPAVRWYVDKNPMNFRFLGWIIALFPNARILVCDRDRRDTALSIWSQAFDSVELGFAYDFADIERCIAGHDVLLKHWLPRLGASVYRVDYERLARSPQNVVAEIQTFIGMPPSNLLDATGASKTTVNTASVWQVRQPIYSSSIGRAEVYSALLPELLRFPSRPRT